jgi:lipase
VIFTRAFGAQGDPALLLHCSLGHSGGWAGLMAALRTPLAAVAMDLPGHGRSDPWDGRGEYQGACAALAEGLLRAPALLIGHSFGATVALRLARARPDLVRAMVLIEPVMFKAAQGSAGYAASLPAMQALDAALIAQDWPRAADVFLSAWGEAPFAALPPPAQARIVTQMPLVAAGGAGIHLDTGGILDAGALEAMEMPVLILEGAESPPVIAAIQAALAARLPQATRCAIAQAGHMAPITHPQATARIIDDWLAGHRAK